MYINLTNFLIKYCVNILVFRRKCDKLMSTHSQSLSSIFYIVLIICNLLNLIIIYHTQETKLLVSHFQDIICTCTYQVSLFLLQHMLAHHITNPRGCLGTCANKIMSLNLKN